MFHIGTFTMLERFVKFFDLACSCVLMYKLCIGLTFLLVKALFMTVSSLNWEVTHRSLMITSAKVETR